MAGNKSLLQSAKASTEVLGIGSPFTFSSAQINCQTFNCALISARKNGINGYKGVKHLVIDLKAFLHHYLEVDFAVQDYSFMFRKSCVKLI